MFSAADLDAISEAALMSHLELLDALRGSSTVGLIIGKLRDRPSLSIDEKLLFAVEMGIEMGLALATASVAGPVH